MMRRREFIAGIGSAAAWPLAARAQQQALPVIGVLGSGSMRATQYAVATFLDGLRQQGFAEEHNVTIEYSWADGHFDLLPSMAAEFVRRRVAVIVTLQGTITTEAAKAATSTIPIVFTLGSDPVAAGLVKSLSRPGGNLTGATAIAVELVAKRLELLHDLVPSVAKFAFLTNPGNPTYSATMLADLQRAAAALGKEVQAIPAASDSDFDPAFERMTKVGVGALLISGDPFYASRRERIVELAAGYRIPTIYSRSEYVKAGGLMSYGPSITFTWFVAGAYAGRILKGEKPADLPVVQPTTFELVFNLKTAKALGLTVPQSLLLRADEVIE
jgi:putative ABC transport system substrate-binding protein